MTQVISESQSGFVRDRSIHNNIRLVLDILDYGDRIEDDGFILFLDFCKAFDKVEHPFMLDTLKHIGFGEHFYGMRCEMFYSDMNSSVLLPWGICGRVEASPPLFIMAVEMLAIMIK